MNRFVTAAVAVLALGLAGSADPAQASTKIADEVVQHRAGASEARGRQPAAVAGVFKTDGDDVHISSTPPRTASAHGWWIKYSGPGSTAKVTVLLQVIGYYGEWDTVAVGSAILAPGGGSGRRATARKTCSSSAATTWRSEIDVDIINVSDTPERLITDHRRSACAP